MSKKKRNSSRREVQRQQDLKRMFAYFNMSTARREQAKTHHAFAHMDLSWVRDNLGF